MVQQHAVNLHNTDGVVEVLTELEPLADKTAATLATSLEGVLRQVCSAIAKGISGHDRTCWLTHVLVGDGVASNALAARRVFAMTSAAPLAEGAVKHLLAFLNCASHQANLVAKAATVGAAARLGAGSDKGCNWCQNDYVWRRRAALHVPYCELLGGVQQHHVRPHR